MKPFSALVIKSTVEELVVRLSNGHELKASPQPELHFGQPVYVCFDQTKNRVASVRMEFLEEDPDKMLEPSSVMVIPEDVGDVDCYGSVN